MRKLWAVLAVSSLWVECCIACDAGSYIGLTPGSCEKCPMGTWKSDTGEFACTDCFAGTHSAEVGATNVSACTPCPRASTSVVGSSSVGACKCNPGFHGADGEACTDCPPGTFKSFPGSEHCTDCGDNTYSKVVAASAESTCGICPKNSSSQMGSAACVCDAGYFMDDDESCTLCAPGKYSLGIAPSLCQSCPSNSYSGAGSALNDCICNVGSTGVNGGACTLCESGKFKTHTGDAGCEQCATSFTSQPGSTGPCTIKCPSDSVSVNGITCESCSTGKHKAREWDQTCCKGGEYLQFERALCLACALGTYSAPKDTVGERCTACPANTHMLTSVTVRDSSTHCVCNAGFDTQTPGEACIACPPGTWSEGGAHTQCDLCAIGMFSARSKASACTSCIPGFVARTEGSTFCAPNPAPADTGHSCRDGTVAVSMHELPLFIGLDMLQTPL